MILVLLILIGFMLVVLVDTADGTRD